LLSAGFLVVPELVFVVGAFYFATGGTVLDGTVLVAACGTVNKFDKGEPSTNLTALGLANMP
jgi:hypothetical protein